MKRVIVTGSCGLVGSEAVEHFDRLGSEVVGVDNNMRRTFFGPSGDVSWQKDRLLQITSGYQHRDLDIRDREKVAELVQEVSPTLLIHCAAQPSHDRAADIPLLDFDVNAVGTANLLEATRLHAPECVFVHVSTNKVYGDAPNELPLVETKTRWEYARPEDYWGVSELMRIDRSLHSLFGASKLAADILAQEYGRYYGMAVGVFRGGCLTGPAHSGVELHGFLSHLVKKALKGETYTIFGYKGKQVRDQLHSRDVVAAFEAFARAPRPGEAYNLGGGRGNSVSILEAMDLIEDAIGSNIQRAYRESERKGDHICYISDLRKLRDHYPEWDVRTDLPAIIREIVTQEQERLEEA